MRKFSKMLAFALAAAMVFTAFAPAAKADAAEKGMEINKQGKILYVTDGTGINDAAQVGGGKGNVSEYDFAVSNKPDNWKDNYTFTWSSSDEKIITVGKAGLTKAVSVGTADVECLVSDKATGAPLFTLTNTITVKANADSVKIIKVNGEAAEDVEGLTAEAGTVIDLDRAMYDAAGKETTKRGTLVTDYTRWCVTDAEDKDASDVITVNQKNGKFTFTDKVAAGKYYLFCETYQSNKYPEMTAESDKIEVVVDDSNEFEINQIDLDTFEIVFEKAVASVDLSVVSVLPINGEEYELPIDTKTPVVKDNVVTVDLFNTVDNNEKFYFTVNGVKVDKTASVGKVTDIKVTADVNQGPSYPFVVANTYTELKATLYDAEGVNVTDYYLRDGGTSFVEFLENSSTEEAKYSIGADGTIWFEEAKSKATIDVLFHTGEVDETGEETGNVRKPFEFGSIAAKTIRVEKLGASTIMNGATDTKKLSLPLYSEGYTLKVQPVITDLPADQTPAFVVGQDYVVNGVNYGTVSMEETDNSVFAIDRATGEIYTFQKGSGRVIIYLETVENNVPKKTAVGIVPITVTDANKLTSVKLDKTSVVVGMVDGLDEEKIGFTAKDFYGADWTQGIGTVAVKANNTAAKRLSQAEVDAAIFVNGEGKLVVKGSMLGKAFDPNVTSYSVNPQFIVTITNGADKWEYTLSVTVKKVNANAQPAYAIEQTDGAFGDVTRLSNDANTKKEKFVTITLYETNNTVKVAGATASKYVDKSLLEDEDNNQLFIKVTKGATDITNEALVEFTTTEVASGSAATVVTIKFSGVDPETNLVTYDKTGAGNYAVTLYKASVNGAVKSYSTLKTLTGTTTVNEGAYKYIALANDTAPTAEPADLRTCFTINGRDNQATTNTNFTVDATESAGSKTVYVKSITFFEEFDGVKVDYKVDINKAVKIQ